MLKITISLLIIITVACKNEDRPNEDSSVYSKTNVATRNLNEYSLDIQKRANIGEYTTEQRAWAMSLRSGLGLQNSNYSEEVFLRTSYTINSKYEKHPVFQSTHDTRRYLVPSHQFVIDFSTKLVGTLGVGGISLHIPPSKKIAILIAPQKMKFMGVLIGDLKTEVPSPIFSDNSVKFRY